MKFYYCEKCDNVIVTLGERGLDVEHNGAIDELIPNATEGVGEKHLPLIKRSKNKVTVNVGEVTHPMEDGHSISLICLVTDKGCQFRYLKPPMKPVVEFLLAEDDEPLMAYAYCNMHGLFMSKL